MRIQSRRTVTLHQGDSLQVLRKLPDDSVHCVVTSPPYWQLRDYGFPEQFGMEDTFEEFLAKMVEIFAEVKRVMHPSGTLWLNVGDSWNSAMTRGTFGDQSTHGYVFHGMKRKRVQDLHRKNLIGQPWHIAFALQAAGWILRDCIIWHKPNPMPSSVTDRCTPSYEQMFMFSKRGKYFFDQDAIREPLKDPEINKRQLLYQQRKRAEGTVEEKEPNVSHSCSENFRASDEAVEAAINRGANKRNVWTIPTEAFPEAHYATFPRALVEPCLLAGTSAGGCCPNCFEPFVQKRIETGEQTDHGGPRKRADAPGAEVSETSVFRTGKINVYELSDFEQNCNCEIENSAPCVVLDPFSGSGTVGVVASDLGRDYIGIEFSKESIDISKRRIAKHAKHPLFTDYNLVEHEYQKQDQEEKEGSEGTVQAAH